MPGVVFIDIFMLNSTLGLLSDFRYARLPMKSKLISVVSRFFRNLNEWGEASAISSESDG